MRSYPCISIKQWAAALWRIPSTHGASQKKNAENKPASLLIFMLQSKQHPFLPRTCSTNSSSTNSSSKSPPPPFDERLHTDRLTEKNMCQQYTQPWENRDINCLSNQKINVFPCCASVLQERRSFICGNTLLASLLVRQGLYIYFYGFVTQQLNTASLRRMLFFGTAGWTDRMTFQSLSCWEPRETLSGNKANLPSVWSSSITMQRWCSAPT